MEKLDVKIKDRNEDIEYLRIALVMCEIGVSYTQSDLIIRVIERLSKLKGKFAISDSVEILFKWKSEWLKYFNEQEKELEKMQSNQK